ncbi:hypothetical protein [Agrobacterium sp. CNPSo 2736]|uniref:hypothetical protein n=1 Tax=Agrobacterium sp. CNPSo 2736 TaxID=2499627 RepID=UPI0013E3C49C|nr:hypothetical protein [Agrobacterium sp. CNPSo 2736]
MMTFSRDVEIARLSHDRATANFELQCVEVDRITAAINSTVSLLLSLSITAAASLLGLL